MLRFQDIFIIQIIGLLRSRKFCGDCHLQIKSLLAQFQFAEGQLIDVICGNLDKTDALLKMLWSYQGGIALTSHNNYIITSWECANAIRQSISESCPPMPDSCPFINHLFLEKSKAGFQDESVFMKTGQVICNNVRSGISTSIDQAQKGVPLTDFWKSFFYLMSSGRIMGDYGQNLSILLLKIQGLVINNLQKMLGKRVAELYQECLSQEMDTQWPNLPKHRNYDRIYGAYDRIYGTAPYRVWAKLLSEMIAKAASTAMGHVCYKKSLTSLTPEEARLLQQLLD